MGQLVRFAGVRKLIAGRMQQSLQSTAQLTYHAKADISAIDRLLPEWKAAGKPYGLQDCLIYALCRALAANPLLNGTAVEDGYSLESGVNLAMAFSTKAGLITPVLRAVEVLDLAGIATKRRELTSRALEGGLKVSEMSGGTFTLSNLGLTAVEYFTPILNAPQIAILGIGSSQTVPTIASDGSIVARKLLPLSLTADHRVVDGYPAGRFVSDLVGMLGDSDWGSHD